MAVSKTVSAYKASSGTQSVTFPKGTNLVTVCVAWLSDGSHKMNSKGTVTVDGQAATCLYDSGTYGYGGDMNGVVMWYLAGAIAGAKDIIYTPNGNSYAVFMIAGWSRADERTPMGDVQSVYYVNYSPSATYTVAHSKGNAQGAVLTDIAVGASFRTIPSGYTAIGTDNYRNSHYKYSPAVDEVVTYELNSAGYGHLASAIIYPQKASGSGVSFGPYFRLFKNFELPWKKQDNLWLPNNEGIQTI